MKEIFLTILFIVIITVISIAVTKNFGIYELVYHSRASDIFFFIIGIYLTLQAGYSLFFKH